MVAFQSNAIERAAAATRSVKDRTPEEIATDEDYWAEIRNAFTIDRNIINLNNGYVSPRPATVQDAMRRYLEYTDMGPYHTMINILERQVEARAPPARRRPPAAIPRRWRSRATPANRSRTRSTASTSNPATKSSPPTRTIRAC